MIVIAKDANGVEREFSIGGPSLSPEALTIHFENHVAGYSFVKIQDAAPAESTPATTGGNAIIGS